jgi:hypothetical protein
MLKVTPVIPALATEPLTFVLQVSSSSPEETFADSATVGTYDQTPVFVRFGSGDAGSRSAVIMPYLVGDDADMRRLLQCKEEHRQAALRR